MIFVGVLVLGGLSACGSSGDPATPSLDATTDAPTDVATGTDASASDSSIPTDASGQIVIGTAGDISDNAIGDQKKTSDLLVKGGYDAVLLLGDNQYPDGVASDFTKFYEPTWGRVKAITRPSPGNHDYHTVGAAGYYGYFGAAAGDPTKGYYSYDLGAWHLIALNTNESCTLVPCDGASAQVAWLKADLAKNKTKCTLAYWHHPRFNSGTSHGNFTGAQAIWDALYAADADVVLNGHEHLYERFDPQTPAGAADATRGLRQFTVGTGGAGLYTFGAPKPNSVARDDKSFGILKLTLKADSYDWEFIPVAPSTYSDKGSGTCH